MLLESICRRQYSMEIVFSIIQTTLAHTFVCFKVHPLGVKVSWCDAQISVAWGFSSNAQAVVVFMGY